MEVERSSGNVFVDLGFDQAMAANYKLRAELAIAIEQTMKARGWSQTEAAEHFEIGRTRLNDVLRGRLEKVTIDRMVNMLAAAGRRVDVTIDSAA